MASLLIRPMPEGYAKDCWIVTGAVYSSEVRYYRKLQDAKRYAKALIQQYKTEGYYPRCITIEERLSDVMQRLPVLETFNDSGINHA